MVIISSKRNYLDYLDSLNSRKQCSSANSTVMHFRIQVSIELKSPLSAKFQFSNFQNKLKRAYGKNGKLALHCFQWGKSGLKTTICRNSGHFFQGFIFLCTSAPQIASKFSNFIRFEWAVFVNFSGQKLVRNAFSA